MSAFSSQIEYECAAAHLEESSSEEILDWLIAQFPRRALSCSFGGPGGLVLLDMLLRKGSACTVYCLDTDLLFPDTYKLIERIEERYRIDVTTVKPELNLTAQGALYGDALWERDPDRCCLIRKVEPQREFLRDFDVLVTGLRRTSGPQRSATKVVDWEPRSNIAKLNPLATWDEKQLWQYVHERDIPYNALNERGYPSVGCTPCTRAVRPGESERDGRWPEFAKTECGLHHG